MNESTVKHGLLSQIIGPVVDVCFETTVKSCQTHVKNHVTKDKNFGTNFFIKKKKKWLIRQEKFSSRKKKIARG